MSEGNKRELIETYLNAYNNLDAEGMMEGLHPEVEFVNVSGGEISTKTKGVGSLKDLAMQSLKYFTSRNQTITKYESSEDKTIIDVDYIAVIAIDLPNGIKAGETLKLKGRSEFTFLDGKIKSITDVS